MKSKSSNRLFQAVAFDAKRSFVEPPRTDTRKRPGRGLRETAILLRRFLVSFALSKLYLASCLSSRDGLADAAISILTWIRFEVHRVGESVSPVEAMLFHDCDDASTLRVLAAWLRAAP